MIVPFEITNVEIIRRKHGTDRVYLYTNLPSPFPKEVSDSPLALEFTCTRGTAEQYVETELGIKNPTVAEYGC